MSRQVEQVMRGQEHMHADQWQADAGSTAHASGTSGDCQPSVAALEPGQRWSAGRKREVVLRLLRGESVDDLSREIGVEIYRLEAWRERALIGIDASLRERKTSADRLALDSAMKRIGELTMDNELLVKRCNRCGVSPLVSRRSGK